MISAEAVKQLREKTGLAMIECKKALEEAQGDETKALELLKTMGAAKAAKKAEREIKAGIVASYIHSNQKIGALLTLGCETDFVGRNENFQSLARDLCMQIAATNPANIEELLAQPFIKNPEQTVQALINNCVAKLGENIKIVEFTRFSI